MTGPNSADAGDDPGDRRARRGRLVAWALTALALLAVVVIAATIEAGTFAIEPRGELPSPTGVDGGDTASLSLQCPVLLADWRLFGGAIVAGGALAAVLNLRDQAGTTLFILAVPVYALWAGVCEPYPWSRPRLALGGGLGPEEIPVEELLYAILLLNVAVLIVLVTWYWYRLPPPAPGRPGGDGSDEPSGQDLAAIGGEAGEIADRIEAGMEDLDNLVYEAWHEMARRVPVRDPSTCTTGEFAEAATAAGMQPDHVDELTQLFDEVRYGDAPAAEREDRAVAVLRRIESSYAAEEGPDAN